MSTRRGLSLTELLVVLAIIGILIALLLPAVQAARETARRMQCQSRLRQLGLAIASYHTTFRQFPASGIVQRSDGPYHPRSGSQYSWIVLILNQLDQAALHDDFDFWLPVFEQPAEPQSVFISTLLCPSDSGPGREFRDPELTGGKTFAKGNYAAFVSPYHVEFQNRFPGALIGGGRHDISRIVDGASNTLMLSEVLTRAHIADQRGAWALPWTGSSQLAFDMHDIRHDFGYGGRGYTANPLSIGANQPPNNQGPNTDILYACPDPARAQLDRMPCNVFEIGSPREYLSAAPRSSHVNGVNVVFVDGHLGFLTDQVDSMAMAHLISVEDRVPVTLSNHVH